MRVIEVNMERRRNGGAGKWEISEKTRRPTASSGTVPTCENPVTRPGIEPGSPWWEASVLIAQPPSLITSVYATSPATRPRYATDRTRYDTAQLPAYLSYLPACRPSTLCTVTESAIGADCVHANCPFCAVVIIFFRRPGQFRKTDIFARSVRRSAFLSVARPRILKKSLSNLPQREIPEKTHQPAASSSAIPTCENPGVARPGTEPGSPWWEAISLTAQTPRASQQHLAPVRCKNGTSFWNEDGLGVLRRTAIIVPGKAQLNGLSGGTRRHTRKKKTKKPTSEEGFSDKRKPRVSEVWSSAGMKGRVKRGITEKTRRPTASSGTIPTSEDPE
ncbi:hypothetical protein PR048_027326 [Dryococelus australis]|uniref:Uncharacterized protein n=1 Tax=Dryococelus australis TaxID=614101 RepID=A0ABQ9GFB9_9NEOP|nr:hypothetical protein PR048_027326 [Dryococelus australis]